jgi:hypothetical protein
MHGCLFLYPLTIIQVHKLNYQKNGHFIRPDSTFRNSVSSDPSHNSRLRRDGMPFMYHPSAPE